jgi:hypothetical protein
MKKPILTASCAILISIVTPVQGQTTLVADTFDRADDTDLNAEATGKSGTLGALNWIEVASGGNPAISSNTLRIGETGGGGGGWSLAYPDHNFIDSAIANGGEFTVSVALVGPVASGGNTRLTGFAVGNSKAELDAWPSSTPTAFNADFFFGYDPTASGSPVGSYIFRAGQQVYQDAVNLSTGGATLSVRFFDFSDFNANTVVKYEAFINGGSPIATGTFFWSGTDENYIALYSNYTLDRGVLDNFVVSTAGSGPAPDPEITSIAVSGNTATVVMTGAPGTDYYCAGSADLTGWTTEIVPTSPPGGSPFQTDVNGDLTFTIDASLLPSSYFLRVQDTDPSP